MEYFAKSPEKETHEIEVNGTASVVRHKTLAEHLEETVRSAEEFFSLYGDYFTEKQRKLIIYACRIHDLGKANLVFQNMVDNPALKTGSKKYPKQIPHGFLSALILSEQQFLQDNPEFTDEDFRVLLTAVFYHHDREDNYEAEFIEEYSNKYFLDCIREFTSDAAICLHKVNRNKLLFSHRGNRGRISDESLHQYMIVKGMLNKFDWSVSAGYMSSEREDDRYERLLCNSIKAKYQDRLKPSQVFMQKNCDSNIVIIAPTGSGKTEAALLWINGEKAFYTLPLKVSSNAIYERIKHGYDYTETALLHSDSLSEYIRENSGKIKEGYNNYEQAKMLAYPLTVCTVDQIFRFVYRALGTEVFAATLKYSKVVIDEIQSYSPEVVAALIYGVMEIQKIGGKFAIITATFPPVLEHFMKRCGLARENEYLYKDFSSEADKKRHKIRICDEKLNISEILSQASNKKILVICNTVSNAQNTYKELSMLYPDVFLLHSRYIKAHRSILEKNIMEFSADEKATGIWVTTQIVEASLDIDFDILYTEMCTADSLLQRMGRCNRAGRKLISESGNVIVYNAPEGCPIIYDKVLYQRSLSELRKYDRSLMSEREKILYINDVYDVNAIKNSTYYKNIDRYINMFLTLKPLDYTLDEVRRKFRKIESITVIPDVIYDENRQKIHDIIEMLNDNHHFKKGERRWLSGEIKKLTLSISMFGDKYPENVDRVGIANTGIHRTSLEYEFNVNTGKGLGLVLNKVEEENFFV